MFYAVRKGELALIYKANKPPKVVTEAIEVPAKERGLDSLGRRRWRKVQVRLVQMHITGGKLIGTVRANHLLYGFGITPPSPGEVTQLPTIVGKALAKRLG